MTLQKTQSTSKPPLFDGMNYGYLKSRMEMYFIANYDILMAIKHRFKTLADANKDIIGPKEQSGQQKKFQTNAKSIITIHYDLCQEESIKIEDIMKSVLKDTNKDDNGVFGEAKDKTKIRKE